MRCLTYTFGLQVSWVTGPVAYSPEKLRWLKQTLSENVITVNKFKVTDPDSNWTRTRY